MSRWTFCFVLIQTRGWVFLGLKTLAVRYGTALVTYVVLWTVLRSVLQPTTTHRALDWLDALFFAYFAVAATIVWTAFALGLRLWRAVEVATTQRRIGPVLGYTVIYGIAFAVCAVADQLIAGLWPCADRLVEPPGSLFVCILTRGAPWMLFTNDLSDLEAQLQTWPTYDLGHYGPSAILALVIVSAGVAFRNWRRG
jgi:hypothetical protein